MFRSIFEDESSNGEGIFEESIILVLAESQDAAKSIAEEIGRGQQTQYQNAEGNLVRWVFLKVWNIYQIQSDKLDHGTELFSRHLKESEVKSISEGFN
ncbi:MAG: DUF4288 domain-containing protein [Bdellovibrionales bacterium]|nr:DUF4288 domain-containing protein [Bdellovibrionales bacterium]